jgi:hypothetical protein
MEENRAMKKASRPAAMQPHFIRRTSSAQASSAATSVILAGFGTGSQVRNWKWLPPRSANTILRFLLRGNARKNHFA